MESHTDCIREISVIDYAIFNSCSLKNLTNKLFVDNIYIITLVLFILSANSLLGRLIYLFGPFLSTALNRSPLRFCDSKKKNPQKS